MSVATATTLGSKHIYTSRLNVKDSGGSGSYLDVDELVTAYNYSKFRRLLKKWRSETHYFSTVEAKIKHSAFEEIVKMGEQTVPWIVEELQTQRDFLFIALHFILEEDPTAHCAKGKPIELIEAWLLWAEQENIRY